MNVFYFKKEEKDMHWIKYVIFFENFVSLKKKTQLNNFPRFHPRAGCRPLRPLEMVAGNRRQAKSLFEASLSSILT